MLGVISHGKWWVEKAGDGSYVVNKFGWSNRIYWIT
jgi:hypothetical protein